MIAGIEHSMLQNIREEWVEVKAMMDGRIPTNDLYLVNRIGELHAGIISLDRYRLKVLMEKHGRVDDK